MPEHRPGIALLLTSAPSPASVAQHQTPFPLGARSNTWRCVQRRHQRSVQTCPPSLGHYHPSRKPHLQYILCRCSPLSLQQPSDFLARRRFKDVGFFFPLVYFRLRRSADGSGGDHGGGMAGAQDGANRLRALPRERFSINPLHWAHGVRMGSGQSGRESPQAQNLVSRGC